FFISFFFSDSADLPALHSFPTRRSSDLGDVLALDDRLVGLNPADRVVGLDREHLLERVRGAIGLERPDLHLAEALATELRLAAQDRKSTRLNSSHLGISYAVFCLKKKKT